MMSLLQFLDVVVLPEILANSREMDWKTQPAASVWCASHHCILKDTIFGILLFFERLDDVRSFSNTDERFVFILKKMNGSFEPFTAFKRIDVLDGFPRIYKATCCSNFSNRVSIFEVFFTHE
jgi:hypothetical protein